MERRCRQRAERSQQQIEIERLAQDAAIDQVARVVEHAKIEHFEFRHDAALVHAIGKRANRVRIVTDACVGKFIEPSVSDAISGFSAPSRSRTAARSWRLRATRPLVDTQITTSGAAARTRETMSRYTSRSDEGRPSASRAWR